MQENSEISQYKLGLRDKIVEVAMNLFIKNGIRLVRMDDVAHEMGISKRTIYELYEKKEDLLYEVVVCHFKQRQAVMADVLGRCNDVMEILLEVYHQKVADFKNTNPLFFTEMIRYPQLLQFLNDQNLMMRQHSLDFYHRGVEEGYFRPDVNYSLAIILFDVMGQFIMEKELYRTYSIEEIFKNIVFVSIRGMCTERGIRAIDKILG
jgi:AcrR family transcriptional regulator